MNVKVKLNLFVTFCPLNALFNFDARVGFCRKFKTRLRHRSQKGANDRKKNNRKLTSDDIFGNVTS